MAPSTGRGPSMARGPRGLGLGPDTFAYPLA